MASCVFDTTPKNAVEPGGISGRVVSFRSYPVRMSDYRPPLRDIRFVLDHIAHLEGIAALPSYEHVEVEDVHLGEHGVLATPHVDDKCG